MCILGGSQMNEIKDLLKEKRCELGYTMKDVADRVGVSEATVSRWESGEIQNMRRNNIVALSRLFELSPSTIMGWDITVNQDNNKGVISNNIASDDNSSYGNSTTTNNYYSNDCGHCAEPSSSYSASSQNKDFFFEIVDNIRKMSDEQLHDVLRYTEFILSKK